MKISELKKGDNAINLLLQKKIEKETKAKATYVIATYTDGENTICAKMWNSNLSSFPGKEGEVHELLLTKQEYQGYDDFTIKEIKKSEESAENFIPCIKEDVTELYEQCIEVAKSLRSSLRDIVLTIFEKYEEKIKTMPAAKSVHHEVKGGLLLHIYRMLSAAISLCDVYEADWDMVFASIMLHDIGKIREMEMDEMGVTRYLPEGTLLGHMPLGFLIVQETAKELGTNEEDLMILSHCILAHQGTYEMQSCALPSCKEAVIVHNLDMIDSRLYQFEKHEKTLQPGEHTEKAISTLGNARVYKRK